MSASAVGNPFLRRRANLFVFGRLVTVAVDCGAWIETKCCRRANATQPTTRAKSHFSDLHPKWSNFIKLLLLLRLSIGHRRALLTNVDVSHNEMVRQIGNGPCVCASISLRILASCFLSDWSQARNMKSIFCTFCNFGACRQPAAIHSRKEHRVDHITMQEIKRRNSNAFRRHSKTH